MSKNYATRKCHGDRHANRRRRLVDNFCLCGAKVSKSGEAMMCHRCVTNKEIEHQCWKSFESQKLSDFIKTDY